MPPLVDDAVPEALLEPPELPLAEALPLAVAVAVAEALELMLALAVCPELPLPEALPEDAPVSPLLSPPQPSTPTDTSTSETIVVHE